VSSSLLFLKLGTVDTSSIALSSVAFVLSNITVGPGDGEVIASTFGTPALNNDENVLANRGNSPFGHTSTNKQGVL